MSTPTDENPEEIENHIEGSTSIEEQAVEEITIPVSIPDTELAWVKPETPDDIVTVEVILGTVVLDGERYEKGQTFQTTRKRASSIDQKFIKIV